MPAPLMTITLHDAGGDLSANSKFKRNATVFAAHNVDLTPLKFTQVTVVMGLVFNAAPPPSSRHDVSLILDDFLLFFSGSLSFP
jgi:hypothetical protein